MIILVIYKLDIFGLLWLIIWIFKMGFKVLLKYYLKVYKVDEGVFVGYLE